MNHQAETDAGHLHAGAGVPDVRDGDPGRRRARPSRNTRSSISELWSRFSEVAAGNPYAWIRDGQDRRGDPHVTARQPDDRAPVPEVHELEQRRRHGARR